MEKITLSDGRQFDVDSFAIASSGHMFIRVKMPMNKAASEFAHGTERIVYEVDDRPPVAINGFTELAYIVNESDCVRVALIRPMDIQEV
jgi:hypothetical protein